MNILVPVLTLSGLGIIFGAGLAIAAEGNSTVATDPRLEKIYAKLPGGQLRGLRQARLYGFCRGPYPGICAVELCAVMQDEDRAEVAAILGWRLRPRSSWWLFCIAMAAVIG